ncbi:MAG: SpoIIE family protein phosphatase [Melioribacteraceae bacterium]|nr:SpoIIE family protein phosphatase [Melioribacteraceae bacterium]
MKNFNYDVYESKVESGDVILMISDGMPELQNNNDEMYGYEKIKELVTNTADKTSDEIIKVLENESKVWQVKENKTMI